MTAPPPAHAPIHRAMVDLKEGRISPDDFRAIMARSRRVNGEAKHTALKARAIANFNGAIR